MLSYQSVWTPRVIIMLPVPQPLRCSTRSSQLHLFTWLWVVIQQQWCCHLVQFNHQVAVISELTQLHITQHALNLLDISPNFFHYQAAYRSSFFVPNLMAVVRWGPPNRGHQMQEVWKITLFTNISLFLGNDSTYGHSYYGMPIGTCMQSIELCHFQWTGMTPNPDFKVMPLFDTWYLRNVIRQRHTYNGILIQTYTYPTQGCHFRWPWVTSSDLAKYSTTRSIVWLLCNSWALKKLYRSHKFASSLRKCNVKQYTLQQMLSEMSVSLYEAMGFQPSSKLSTTNG